MQHRLRQRQALLLTTGEMPHRRRGVRGGPDSRDGLADAGPFLGLRKQGQTPAMAVVPQSHEVSATDGKIAVEKATLRDVPNHGRATPCGPASDQHCATGVRLQSQQDAQERAFTGAIRAEHNDELTGMNLGAEIPEEPPAAKLHADAGEGDQRRRGGWI